jgi:hypothetical protein
MLRAHQRPQRAHLSQGVAAFGGTGHAAFFLQGCARRRDPHRAHFRSYVRARPAHRPNAEPTLRHARLGRFCMWLPPSLSGLGPSAPSTRGKRNWPRRRACLFRSSRFGVGLGAEEKRERQALRLLSRRRYDVFPGVRPLGGHAFCAFRRKSTEKGRRAKSHSQECKTPGTL